MKKEFIAAFIFSLGFIVIYAIKFNTAETPSAKQPKQALNKPVKNQPNSKSKIDQSQSVKDSKSTKASQAQSNSKATQQTSAVIHITKENIAKEIYQSDMPVVLDIYSTVCPPCKKLSPIIEELAHQYKNKYKFCKLNIDKNFAIANKYKVKSLPTLIFIKNNEIKGRSGFIKKDKIIDKLSIYFS